MNNFQNKFKSVKLTQKRKRKCPRCTAIKETELVV